jgi:hypothetical protein
MATTAQYAATARTATTSVSTANTNRNGTGTIATVFTAGTNGSRIDDIFIVAQGTTTANVVRLFVNDGTTSWLWQEIIVPAITPSTSVAVFSAALLNQSLILATSSWSLRASTNNAETYNILVTRAGDF